jgi:tRNA (guanine-N7-)-methyltransferase
VALAERFPQRNFVGIDIKGARIWRGAKTSDEKQLKNVAFLRTRIDQINSFFDLQDHVNEIWITFPDPQLRESKEKKRLTSEAFLNRYRKFCTKDCIVHLKTDSPELFHYTRDLVRETGLRAVTVSEDIDKDMPDNEILSIRTFYEKHWRTQGLKIQYISFYLNYDL